MTNLFSTGAGYRPRFRPTPSTIEPGDVLTLRSVLADPNDWRHETAAQAPAQGLGWLVLRSVLEPAL